MKLVTHEDVLKCNRHRTFYAVKEKQTEMQYQLVLNVAKEKRL